MPVLSVTGHAGEAGQRIHLTFADPADVAELVEVTFGSDGEPQALADIEGEGHGRHSFPEAQGTFRREGIHAGPGETVTVLTRPFPVLGEEELRVDADADGKGGYVFIVIEEADGQPIPDYTREDSLVILGDGPDQLVTWNAHRKLPPGEREIRLRITLCNATLFAVKTRPPEATLPAVLEVGLDRQLFADPALIGSFRGEAELFLHRPIDRGVVFTLDMPWEGNTSAYFTVLEDAGLYRLYYRGLNHDGTQASHPVVACVAESLDGLHWTRPNLGQVEFEGSTHNNILDVGDRRENRLNFTPFIDTRPDCPPGERYKAIAGENFAAYGYTSPDGLRWTQIEEPFFEDYPLDSQQTVFYDAESGLYHAYIRVWNDSRWTSGVRGIMLSTSADFRTWSRPRWLTYPGTVTQQLYTNNILEYHRAPHLFLGFPNRFVEASNVEPLFMVSRDGLTFRRWEEAIIRPGRNPRQWGNRSNYLWYGLVETASPWDGQVELSLYSGEEYYRGEAIKLRRWAYRPDGFVSVQAPLSGGTVTTVPLSTRGTRLVLNYSTAAGGHVEVAVLDAEGRAIAVSERMTGDEVEGLESFANDDGWGQGPIQLRFRLFDADIFAFRFLE